MSAVRVFIAEAVADWSELTDSGRPAVRIQARDLQHAQRASRGLHQESDASVVLDVKVLIASDRRSARQLVATLAACRGAVHYVGTVEGLAGLVEDIYAAGVADGVTLIPLASETDVRSVGTQVLRQLELRRLRRTA